MKKSQFTEEQIAYALHEVEIGTSVAEICRKLGVSEQTFYRWKKKFAGMGIAELRRLKQLEEENRKLKQLVADLSLDKHMLQEVIQKKTVKPGQRRALVQFLCVGFQVSERRACQAIGSQRSSYRYRSMAKDQTALQMRIRDLAAARVRYGYRRLHVYSGVKAGKSITSVSTACIALQGYRYDSRPARSGSAQHGCFCHYRQRLTSAGVWIL